jgi:fatty acid-binding protein DegV
MAKIVVDSGCDISAEIIARAGVPIEAVPLTLRPGEKIFTDTSGLCSTYTGRGGTVAAF